MKLPALSLAVLLAVPTLFAQAPASPATQSAAPLPSFLIADVHNSKYSPYPSIHGGQIFGDRYVLHDATMVDLIHTAYGIDNNNIQGGPSWLERDRFEIVAKVPPRTTSAQANLMLRKLLADRFQLVTHTGSKPMPAWILTAKDKSKLKEADGSGSFDCKNEVTPPAPGSPLPAVFPFTCSNATIAQLLPLIRNFLGTTESVVDQTGLTAAYNLHFTATPQQLIGRAGSDAIPIQVAFEKELGLQLTHDTAPREVLLVDTVLRKPTPNSAAVAKELPPPPPPEFEVATIRPSDPNSTGAQARINGGQVNVHNVNLKMIIPLAWNLNQNDDNAVANEPKWFESDKWDIVAKVSPGAIATAAAAGNGDGATLDIDDLRRALQKLVIDRFQMKVHMEDRPIDSFRLVALSPKLAVADPNTRTACHEGPGKDGKDPRTANPTLNRLLTCTNMTMDDIADELQRVANGYVHNPIENATGLKGGYDFTLSFSSIDMTSSTAPNAAGNPNASGTPATSDPTGGLTLFEAVQHQLGLKLEQVKRPLPVLVIDSAVEKPLDN